MEGSGGSAEAPAIGICTLSTLSVAPARGKLVQSLLSCDSRSVGGSFHYQLIASDLDGTLLRDDGTISDRTRRALSRATDEGVYFVVATARSVMMFEPLIDNIGDDGVAICSNGAVLYDLRSRSIIFEQTIDPGLGAAVVAIVRDVLPAAVFAVDSGKEFSREPRWEVREFMRGRESAIASAEELVSLPVCKLMVRFDNGDPDGLVRQLRKALGSMVTVTNSTSWGLVEISAPGVTKAQGLKRHSAALGIGAPHVAAVGDMPNDRPMLEWAGCAVVVANASPELLAIADVVTASNEDDGVAIMIESLLDSPYKSWARSTTQELHRFHAL